ncbi:MAG: MerR family transcriptional regulator, partial [Chloroflexi bacterium]|nr:MerR family transcriptional regulator [Chloroflexota bacterium]
ALFIISVAARLVGLHVNTLRKYEREGFLEPSRTGGRLRLYSPEDLVRLHQIKVLVDGRGLNLAGVQLALELADELRATLEWMRATSPDPAAWERLQRQLAALLEMVGAPPASQCV